MTKVQRALVTVQKFAHCLSLYDLETGSEIAQIKLPDYPHEFVVSPDGRYAYVGHYGIPTQFDQGEGGCSVFVIDLQRQTHTRTLKCWPYYRIHGIATDRDGRLYALSEAHSVLLVFERPWANDAPDRVVDSGGHRSHLVRVTQDGRLAFCVNLRSHTVTVLRPHDPLARPKAIYTGQQPEGNCLSLDEQSLYITNRQSQTITRVDVGSLRVLRHAATGVDPTRVVPTTDGRLLVTNYGEHSIGVYDCLLNLVGTIKVEANPIAVGDDAQAGRAYATLKNGKVAVIDMNSLCVERDFPVRAEPDGVSIIEIQH